MYFDRHKRRWQERGKEHLEEEERCSPFRGSTLRKGRGREHGLGEDQYVLQQSVWRCPQAGGRAICAIQVAVGEPTVLTKRGFGCLPQPGRGYHSRALPPTKAEATAPTKLRTLESLLPRLTLTQVARQRQQQVAKDSIASTMNPYVPRLTMGNSNQERRKAEKPPTANASACRSRFAAAPFNSLVKEHMQGLLERQQGGGRMCPARCEGPGKQGT